MRSIVNDFNLENRGEIKVKADSVLWDNLFLKLIQNKDDTANSPHLVVVPANRVALVRKRGIVRTIEDLPEYCEVTQDDYLEGAWNVGVQGGARYSFPLDMHPTLLYYNKDLISEEELPSTWEEFIAIAKAKTTDRVYGWAIPSMYSVTLDIYMNLLIQNGTDLFELRNGNYTPVFNSQLHIDLLEQLRTWKYVEKISPVSVGAAGDLTLFNSGKSVFYFDGIYQMNAMYETSPIDWGTVQMPNTYGPDGHQTSAVLYVNQIVAASTFSKESLLNRGKFFGEESLYLGFKHIYAPGANIHRTPYSGRNFEYYSEDATMSYICSKAQEQGMVEKGLAGMIKHFAGNDQETNRHGVATFMSEQAYRQGPLKGFEGALANGSLGTMTAYNRIGCIPTATDYQTMTLVLRNEWGFKGINMTDSSKDSASYMYTADCLYAGTNQFNNDAGRVSEATKFLTRDKDGFMWQKLRETAKYYLYAMSRSNLINGLAKGVKVADFTPWWKPAVITINFVLGVIGLGCTGAYVYLNWFAKSKKKEEN